ncbi:1,2-phenylacetyl-CoA epoxidase subunit PaaC [Bacillus sp. FSL W7-1360]
MSQVAQDAIITLALQLADDDFLFAYRGSEWLGIAPHIEEDVASASISQNSMGHAAMFYELASELGAGTVDELAHGRKAIERKNSILVERVNGPGSYMGQPAYDFAYAVVRNYFYTEAKKIKMDSLENSACEALREIATKVNMELHYHIFHWKTWFVALIQANDEAKVRMTTAITRVMEDFGDLFSYGHDAAKIEAAQLIETEEVLAARFTDTVGQVLASVGLNEDMLAYTCKQNGRNHIHTDDLTAALATLSEVYRTDVTAAW